MDALHGTALVISILITHMDKRNIAYF